MAGRRMPAFRALLGYQINSTCDTLRRVAMLRLRREYGVSLMEWRTLALVEHLQPVRLRDLAADFGADKAQISRIVTALAQRGLVARQARDGNARSAQLELTESGCALVAALNRTAQEGDRAVRDCLRPAEVEQLAGMLARLRSRAQELLDDEERRQTGRASR